MAEEQVQGHAATFAQRFLVAVIDRVCRFPKFVLTVAVLGCAVSLYASATRLQYHTQRSDLINPNKDYQRRWRQYLAEFGDEDDMVVVVRGVSDVTMKAAIESLAVAVREQPEHFDRLFFKVDLRPIRNRASCFCLKNRLLKSTPILRA